MKDPNQMLKELAEDLKGIQSAVCKHLKMLGLGKTTRRPIAYKDEKNKEQNLLCYLFI